jgi:peptidoglycan L-alanyl-D-glutamate endopeptidase CwlK
MSALSARCELRLAGVHPDLVRVVRRAAEGGARFRVTADGGLRTLEQQRKLFESGATKTMDSRHLTGHAVDVVPLDDAGNVSWAWGLYFPLADAFRAAAIAEGVPVIWGGAWGLLMTDYATAKAGQAAYVARMREQGRKPFLDGPHFELPAGSYPAK